MAFARFAWSLLAYEVAVVVWGAYVRASGSGAGCGSHWPLCNGVVLPQAPRVATVIELSHRASSGVALVLSIVLFVWARAAFSPGHPARRGSAAAMAFMFAEALIGAWLVLFRLVEHDASVQRAVSVSLHLVNTFLLLAATALTAWWASGGARLGFANQRLVGWAMAVPLSALLLVGASGAVTALGDTLFPSPSLAAGIKEDFAAGAPWFVHLRAVHPLLASLAAAAALAGMAIARALRPGAAVRRLSEVTTVLVLGQVALGILSFLLLAPVWMQLLHLAMADAVWVAMVLTAAAALPQQTMATVADVPTPDRLAPAPRGPRETQAREDERAASA